MLDLRLALPDDVQHLAVGDKPVKVRCVNPSHRAKDNANSLAVYPTHLHCYGCTLHLGNGLCEEGPDCASCRTAQVQALALLLNTDVETAGKLASQYTSEALDNYRERAASEARRDPLPDALATTYHRVLYGPRVERLDWLRARGLTYATIDEFELGHNGFQFVIPVRDRDGHLLTLRFRRDDLYQTEQRPKYMGLPGRNGFYLYPEHRLVRRPPGWVMVCEGELDAARCWQEGWPAVSATNGARQVPKVIAALRELLGTGLHSVVLATDQDEPGEEAAYVAGREAERAGLRVHRLRWDGAKDITEALALKAILRREDYRAGHPDVFPAAAPVRAGHAA